MFFKNDLQKLYCIMFLLIMTWLEHGVRAITWWLLHAYMIALSRIILLCFCLSISVTVSSRVSLSMEKQAHRFSPKLQFHKLESIRSLIWLTPLKSWRYLWTFLLVQSEVFRSYFCVNKIFLKGKHKIP